jgi:predicted ATPase
MLTRLKVSGFKNLVDVDVRFGPFTCVAGANGVGKSNLFDAIRFLTLIVTGQDGTSHPARALSDGTLRFLALAVMELDPQAQGLLCLEEPENGIHPERIPKILQLLQDIATDVDEPIGIDNPLRQVIVNTHSPAVVMQVPDDSLLVAELKEMVRLGQRFKRVSFGCLPDTWRQKAPEGDKVGAAMGTHSVIIESIG